jgi:battenin
VFVRGINAWALDRVPHKIRIVINAVLFVGGIVGVALAPSFAVSLCAIVAIGSGSSFGESVLLGYLQNYAPELVGGWSSGTGMAGFAGSLLYMGLVASGLNFEGRFLVLLPTCAIYLLAFFFGLSPPSRLVTTADKAAAAAAAAAAIPVDQPIRNLVSPSPGDESSPLLQEDSDASAIAVEPVAVAAKPAPRCDKASMQAGLWRSWRALKMVPGYSFRCFCFCLSIALVHIHMSASICET